MSNVIDLHRRHVVVVGEPRLEHEVRVTLDGDYPAVSVVLGLDNQLVIRVVDADGDVLVLSPAGACGLAAGLMAAVRGLTPPDSA